MPRFLVGNFASGSITKIISSMISVNAMSEEELLEKRSKEEGFKYKLQPYPVSKSLQLTLGEAHGGDPNKVSYIDNPPWVTIPTTGLWGSIIAFGMIGSGKTASIIYCLLLTCLSYRPMDLLYKIGGLILDVKGDFVDTLRRYMEAVGRSADLLVVKPGGDQVWNPIHSPTTPADVLAGRLIAVYENIKPTSNDNGWIVDGILKLFWHCLGIHRLVFGYVTISDIHNIINKTSGAGKINLDSGDETTQTQEFIDATYNDVWLKSLENRSQEEIEEYTMHYNYFFEWANENEKQKSIYVGASTTITGFFEKSDIKKTFCPPLDQITFAGFNDTIDKGFVVILDAPEVTYGPLAQILGILLKLDFQRCALQRIPRKDANKTRPLFFVCDEYQNFVTVSSQSMPQGDDNFFALSRQAQVINLMATQAPVSLEAKVGKEKMRVILASVLTKICLGLSDYQDAEGMANLFGKERQSFKSYNLGENSTGFFNPLTGEIGGKNTGVSQTTNHSNEDTYIIQPTTFMNLRRHEAIVYAYGTTGMMRPQRVLLKTTYVPKLLQGMYTNPRDVPYNQLIQAIEEEARIEAETEVGEI